MPNENNYTVNITLNVELRVEAEDAGKALQEAYDSCQQALGGIEIKDWWLNKVKEEV